MNRRRLGSQGLEVSAEGLGCMGMTWAYGAGDEEAGAATIDRALELGITFLRRTLSGLPSVARSVGRSESPAGATGSR